MRKQKKRIYIPPQKKNITPKAAQYLQQITAHKADIHILEHEISELKCLSEYSNSGNITEIINQYSHELETKQKQVNETIASVQSLEKPLSQILYMRYIEGEQMQTIAEKLNYSRSSINRLHKKAITAFEQILN